MLTTQKEQCIVCYYRIIEASLDAFSHAGVNDNSLNDNEGNCNCKQRNVVLHVHYGTALKHAKEGILIRSPFT